MKRIITIIILTVGMFAVVFTANNEIKKLNMEIERLIYENEELLDYSSTLIGSYGELNEVYEQLAVDYDTTLSQADMEFERELELILPLKELDKEAYLNAIYNVYDYHGVEYETIYDYFSAEEIQVIQQCVETEVYDRDIDSKTNVANVILNRYWDKRFPSTITEVVTNPYQFAYFRTNITESTRLAIEYAWLIEDTTNGCIGFHSFDNTDSFNNWDYQFTDTVGHNFYK